MWQDRRPNYESGSGVQTQNEIDPTRLRVDWRDELPKMNLYDGYLGDGLPLCADLPPRAFLRRGAVYRLLGSSPSPRLQPELSAAAAGPNATQLVLGAGSHLYAALCNRSDSAVDAACRAPSEVTLPASLPCVDAECTLDTARVVRVGAAGLFYEYVRPPCVRLTFHSDARQVRPPSISHLPSHLSSPCLASSLAFHSGSGPPGAQERLAEDVPGPGRHWRGCRVLFGRRQHRLGAARVRVPGRASLVRHGRGSMREPRHAAMRSGGWHLDAV